MSLAQISSSLPPDSRVFQWDRNAVAVWYHSRRIVCWWTGGRYSRAVNVAACRTDQLTDARHFLPHRDTAVDPVSIEFDPYGLRLEVIEVNMDVKDVLLAFGLHLHFAEAKRSPFLFQAVPPSDHLPAACSFFGTPQTEGGKIMNLAAALSSFHGDIYAKGHIHSLATLTQPYLTVSDNDPPRIVNKQKCGAITGCWFETYKQGITPSYGEKKCYRPSAIGCPVFLIQPDRASVSVLDNSTMMASRLG